ncbi:DUF2798 domain-containing protein [Noviherbaspirillum aridicola]|uniref:DUF2798 domain-containing protein n=1 Tax=Noviherbaspirillum aridicola TaxID=2849687 RepID=A0ABQ4Q7E0_9BURK|nr:DUF2798 domain-containing protein [Noviherbaspirillum aridicola]GIZ53123.1 hypothetical protein NCCP691_31370 [Noviherbaspirillum aridicola]
MFAPAPSHYPRPLPAILTECAWFLRGSRSLASLLPPLFISGLLALVISGVTLLTLDAPAAGFTAAWLESWLIAWPIAFPVAWLAFPRRARARARTAALRSHGLGVGSIETASRRVTRRHGMTVLRSLQPARG